MVQHAYWSDGVTREKKCSMVGRAGVVIEKKLINAAIIESMVAWGFFFLFYMGTLTPSSVMTWGFLAEELIPA